MTTWDKAILTAAAKIEALYTDQQTEMRAAADHRTAAYHGSKAAVLRSAIAEIKSLLGKEPS